MENTWIELDLAVLGDNIGRMRAALCAGTELIFVVKSEAYGHGMIPVTRCAIGNGVKWFAVAHTEEAIRLTDNFPGVNVLVLGVMQRDAVAEAAARGITPLVADEEHGLELASAAAAAGVVLKCHVKTDTGMGRLGIHWERAAATVVSLAAARGLALTGICTHLAASDEPETDYSLLQIQRFRAVVEECKRRGIAFGMRHVSNSGGFHSLPACDYEGVRCGIELYGYGPHGAARRIATRPFLQWKSVIAQVKDVEAGFKVGYGSTYVAGHETTIATIDAGYSDGYSRHLGNKAQVLFGGRRVPVVGRVSMNLVTVDLGPGAGARRGDEVVLLGAQGNDEIWADEVARWCGTIPYEVLTSIRAPACYVLGEGGSRSRAELYRRRRANAAAAAT
ncbi:MAG: alanine racemase [bacterium]